MNFPVPKLPVSRNNPQQNIQCSYRIGADKLAEQFLKSFYTKSCAENFPESDSGDVQKKSGFRGKKNKPQSPDFRRLAQRNTESQA